MNLCNFLNVIEFAGNIMLIRMGIGKRENNSCLLGKEASNVALEKAYMESQNAWIEVPAL